MNVINRGSSLGSYGLLMPVKVQLLTRELLVFHALSLYGETVLCVFQEDIIEIALLLNKEIPLNLNEFKRQQHIETKHFKRVCQLCNIYTKAYGTGNEQQLTIEHVKKVIVKLDKCMNGIGTELPDSHTINRDAQKELLKKIHSIDVAVYYIYAFAIGHIINHFLNIPDDYVAMQCALVDEPTECRQPLHQEDKPNALMQCPKYFIESMLHESTKQQLEY